MVLGIAIYNPPIQRGRVGRKLAVWSNRTCRKMIAATQALMKPAKVFPGPIYLQIEPTSRCDLNCIMCPRQRNLAKHSDMTLKGYLQILDQTKPFYVNLTGYGEPLLNQEILEMIKESKKRGIYVNMSSNFTLLSQSEAVKLAQTGIDLVKLSLDAAKAETYRKIRGADLFELVVKHASNFSEIAHRIGRPAFQMVYTLQRDNLPEIEGIVGLAKTINVDYLFVKPLLVGNLSSNEGLLIGNLERDTANKHLRQASRLSKELKVNTNLSSLVSHVSTEWDRHVTGKYNSSSTCTLPFYSCYISSEGGIRICCNADSAEYDLGNVYDDGFQNVWNGEEYRSLRVKFRERIRPYNICDSCDIPSSFSARPDGLITKAVWSIINSL
jgi:radical SAM protein with 4Fe4S-binding SPASM domain